RIAWDLRYPDPPTLNYGYSGTLLDYREYTLNWHALPGKTPVSTLVGPMVPPGTYTAKLIVDGRTYTQPIAVVADPRISVPPSAQSMPRSTIFVACSAPPSPISARRSSAPGSARSPAGRRQRRRRAGHGDAAHCANLNAINSPE